MAGEAAPTDWQGGLNFTYHIGPGFKQAQRHVQMFVSTHTQSARVYNAFGVIEGSVEPGEASAGACMIYLACSSVLKQCCLFRIIMQGCKVLAKINDFDI